MQPTLSITAPAAGMIDMNGRFLGETSPERPLLAPVQPYGAVYIEYQPLEPDYRPMARKLVLSAGMPLPDNLAEDVSVIRWPGGVTELELSPREERPEIVEHLTLDGIPCRIFRGRDCHLEIGAVRCSLPPHAASPQIRRLPGGIGLVGEDYILTLSSDLSRQTGYLQADRLDIDTGGAITALTLQDDVAGHATRERWLLDPAGLRLLSSERTWAQGAPRPPANADEAVRAAIEAALLGFHDEAESHLAPALRDRHPLDSLAELGSMCLPMKYPAPHRQPCVGLLRVDSGSCATVRPIPYRAEWQDGRWMVTELEL